MVSRIVVYGGKRVRFMFLGLALLAPAAAIGHGGGLNAEGCHTNRKTGDYHCHRGARADAQATARSSSPVSLRGGSVTFRNCSQARAAGAAPVRAGTAGYGRHLDRDGDGVGCE